MNAVSIRSATVKDIEHIISLISANKSVLIPHAHSVYWSFINFYPAMNVVAEKDGEIIGWCGGIKPDNAAGFIWQIFVSEDHRRKGLAAQMVQKVMSDNYADGVKVMQLAIARDNEPSINLFSKLAAAHGKTIRKTEENKFLLETYNEDLYEIV